MKRDQTRRLALIGAKSEITRLAREIGDYVRELPELRKHARASIDAVLTTPEARVERAIVEAVKPRQKKRRPKTAEEKAHLSRVMKKRMREHHAGRRKFQKALSDKAAAEKAHRIEPVVKRGRPKKNPAGAPAPQQADLQMGE